MKCLFITLGVNHAIGGEERFNQRLLRSLAEFSRNPGVEYRAVVVWDTLAQAAGMSGAYEPCSASKSKAVARFLRHVLLWRPDVILYGHILLSPLALAARLLGPKSRHLLIVHGLEVWREPFRRRVPLWERAAVRWGIDEIVSVSRLTMERMREAYELPVAIFQLLPNAVDVRSTDRVPSAEARGRGNILTVTRLGKLSHYKGCGTVIRAMPLVLKEFPRATYHIVGEGESRPGLEALARQMGVSGRVRFHGLLGDAELERMYQSADVFILPSKGEGFGIVYLEAWKHGLPVIAGNQDAGAEVVTHGHNGLCVDPDSPEQIAAALIELLSAPHRAAEMGEAGRQTVSEKYSHEVFRARLAAILQREDAPVAAVRSWGAERA
ncbi:MAG: glycosyltransferase family 4 protein [Bryobacteraceae bacterium]|nr:glycosyltransferase family 4 protein [Bryobacteraceae bacterium]